MSTPDRIRAELKRAAKQAYAALQNEGFTSGQIRTATGLSDSLIRKLGSDGDASGWRPPSLTTCAKIDEYCLTRLGKSFDLVRLRRELDATRATTTREQARIDEALHAYLEQLRHTITVAPPWMPFEEIDDSFQQRMLSVTTAPPRRTQDEEITSNRIRVGDVGWTSALNSVGVAVVIADAGYGKSWQARRHAAHLADVALAALDTEQAATPLWMHAAHLADMWPAASPHEAVVDAATVILRQVGMDTRGMQDALATVVDDAESPCVVIVDAYDEVAGARQRAAVMQALRWLSGWTTRGPGRQLIVTSRAAGWDNPLGRSDERPEPTYLHLGVLDEGQVRRLWQAWFSRRAMPVPDDRLAQVLAPASSLRRFARIPLIAAFCAWVAETDVVANTRSLLFGQVVNRFLARTWKSQDVMSDDWSADDGARRAAMAEALAELAWEMTWPAGWADSIGVGDCDSILRRQGPAPLPSRSLTFEAVRGIGILTQPAAAGGERLGDTPVSWVHRTVHEFLAARYLTTRGSDLARPVVERAWQHPSLSGMVDFALGLEPAPASPGPSAAPALATSSAAPAGSAPVHAAVGELTGSGDDPLGYYQTLVAASGQCSRADIDRLWALQTAGVISAQIAAHAMGTSGSEDDWAALADLLIDGASVEADVSVYEALAWCGPPGRAVLDTIVRTSPASVTGVSAAFYQVDPRAAVEAVEFRVAAGLPLTASDRLCIAELGRETVARLVDAVREDQRSGRATAVLGHTHSRVAFELLSQQLQDPDAVVRHAAARGLSAWYGNALDAPGFAIFRDLALDDPDPNLRLVARGTLTAIALSLPWVARAIDDLFDSLHTADHDSPLHDMASLADGLWPVGPATNMIVVMLSEEPRLLRPELSDALESLIAAALEGSLDVQLTRDVARLAGSKFTDSAVGQLASGTLDRTQTTNLAAGLALAAPEDLRVYAALVNTVTRHPVGLLEAAMAMSGLPAATRVRALAEHINGLSRRDPTAVRVCMDTIRRILDTMNDDERAAVRPDCQQATIHALSLGLG